MKNNNSLDKLMEEMEQDPWYIKLKRWINLQKWLLICNTRKYWDKSYQGYALRKALREKKWRRHKTGKMYYMVNANGKMDRGWKIAYYPLFGTYQGDNDTKVWVRFEEPRALIEKPMAGGIDFREVPIRYLEEDGRTG